MGKVHAVVGAGFRDFGDALQLIGEPGAEAGRCMPQVILRDPKPSSRCDICPNSPKILDLASA